MGSSEPAKTETAEIVHSEPETPAPSDASAPAPEHELKEFDVNPKPAEGDPPKVVIS